MNFNLVPAPTVCYFFIQTLPDLRNCYVPENPAQIEFCASRYWIHLWSTEYICTYAQVSPVEIQTTAHWNLIGHSITAPSLVLSPSSILPPPSSRCAFITARKNLLRASKKIMILFCYVVFNYVSLKLRNKICVNRGVGILDFPSADKGWHRSKLYRCQLHEFIIIIIVKKD